MAVEWPDETVLKAIESCITDESIFLVEWNLQNRRNEWQLNVRCDADEGITLDQLAAVNRALRDTFQLPGLDAEQLSIEVSSPGLTYPITKLRHFKRHAGHQIKIEHDLPAVDNPVVGIIEAVDDSSITLRTKKGPMVLPNENIHAGYVQLKW